jgi:hypothetical protein
LSPDYPYTDGGHFQPRDHGYGQSSPGRAEAGHPTFASLTSAQSVAEQTRTTYVRPLVERTAGAFEWGVEILDQRQV